MSVDDSPEQIGRYRIVRRVGRGGMGVLYEARDSVLDRDVAVKVMSGEVVSDENARGRFYREARAAARLQHRNIVTVFEFAEEGNSPYMVMEFLRGRSLADHYATGEPLPLDTKLDIIIQLCEGLQYAHEQGVVHRDVKPANIWLMEDGGVKLLDFGIAKLTGSTFTTAQGGGLVGSAAYSAPEQLAGGEIDGRADVFSAGIVLYELLAGRRPFDASTVTGVMMKILHEPPPDLRTIVPEVPVDVAVAVHTALQKDPAFRFGQAADFGADLRLARYSVDPVPAVAPRPRAQPVPMAPSAVTPVLAPTPPPPAPMPAPARRAPAARIKTAPLPRVPSRTWDAQRLTTEVIVRLREIPLWVAGIGAAALLAVPGYFLRGALSPAGYAFEIHTDPSGAAIAFDGANTGQRTPAVLTLQKAPQRIALALTGFEPVDAVVPASNDRVQRLTYTLRRVLHVQSQPSGGRVLLDGRDTGLVTPAHVALSAPAPQVVEVQLAGYKPAQERITQAVVSGGVVTLALTRGPNPVPSPGPSTPVTVHVSGEYPFEVSGCGRSSQPAQDHTLRVAAPCALRLRAPGYLLDVTRSVDRAPGGRVDISAPRLAHVQLRSRYEWCTVVIGARTMGPPPVDVEMASGSYTVTVQCPERSYLARSFVVEPGRSIRRLDEFLR